MRAAITSVFALAAALRHAHAASCPGSEAVTPVHSKNWDAPVYNTTSNTLSFTVRSSDASLPTSVVVDCSARCTRVATTMTPFLPMLAVVGKTSTIVAHKTHGYVSTPEVKAHLKANAIDFGTNMTYLATATPDCMLTGGKWSYPSASAMAGMRSEGVTASVQPPARAHSARLCYSRCALAFFVASGLCAPVAAPYCRA